MVYECCWCRGGFVYSMTGNGFYERMWLAFGTRLDGRFGSTWYCYIGLVAHPFFHTGSSCQYYTGHRHWYHLVIDSLPSASAKAQAE